MAVWSRRRSYFKFCIFFFSKEELYGRNESIFPVAWLPGLKNIQILLNSVLCFQKNSIIVQRTAGEESAYFSSTKRSHCASWSLLLLIICFWLEKSLQNFKYIFFFFLFKQYPIFQIFMSCLTLFSA